MSSRRSWDMSECMETFHSEDSNWSELWNTASSFLLRCRRHLLLLVESYSCRLIGIYSSIQQENSGIKSNLARNKFKSIESVHCFSRIGFNGNHSPLVTIFINYHPTAGGGWKEKGLSPFYEDSPFFDLNGIVGGRKLRYTSPNNVLMRSA